MLRFPVLDPETNRLLSEMIQALPVIGDDEAEDGYLVTEILKSA